MAVTQIPPGLASWENSMSAAEEVRQRLLRATAALERAGADYAVVGGNAVAARVGSVDRAAVRLTRDVDLLLRRSDVAAAAAALAADGFRFAETSGVPTFLDGPAGTPRDAVHVLYAGEKVKPHDALPAPDVTESERGEHFRLIRLEPLVRMKLTSYRRKDQVHLADMIEVGLIDAGWPARFPPELAARLQHLLDTPNG